MAIETTKNFKSNYKRVKEGNTIQFRRKGHQYEGEVKNIRDMTVIVSVNPSSVPKELAFENNVTVVNHGNYEIMHKTQSISS